MTMADANSVPMWVTLLGFAAPLVALAGSSVAFVVKVYQDRSERQRNQFFELMQFIDSDRPLATKMAAVYQLRSYPEHRDFIIRFCRTVRNQVSGNAGQALINELDETRAFMESQSR